MHDAICYTYVLIECFCFINIWKYVYRGILGLRLGKGGRLQKRKSIKSMFPAPLPWCKAIITIEYRWYILSLIWKHKIHVKSVYFQHSMSRCILFPLVPVCPILYIHVYSFLGHGYVVFEETKCSFLYLWWYLVCLTYIWFKTHVM